MMKIYLLHGGDSWLQEIKPVWDQLKNKIEHPELPEVTSLEQHFTNLDKICSIPSVK